MSSRALGRWMKVMAAIAAAATPVAVACGGQIEGEGSSGGPDLGGPLGTSGSSGRASSSSGTSGTSDRVCNSTRTVQVPYQPPRCETVVDDAGDSDGGPDSGATTVCETENELCERLCDRAWPDSIMMHITLTSCTIVDDGRGPTSVTCRGNTPPCGRAHEGLADATLSDGASAVARWLENAAYLEDASVTSFELLAKELEAHGAPRELVRRAKKSARDEIRHARVMSALAQRHGGRAPRAAKVRRSPRALEAMLRENAIEGCVSETYGAQLAWYQATHASDPKVKAAMARIADDETSHASLAWAIARWGEARLDHEARVSIERAREHAWRELDASLANEPDRELAIAIGLPTAGAARTMARELARAAILV